MIACLQFLVPYGLNLTEQKQSMKQHHQHLSTVNSAQTSEDKVLAYTVYTVDLEIFVVKIFSWLTKATKIKNTK